MKENALFTHPGLCCVLTFLYLGTTASTFYIHGKNNIALISFFCTPDVSSVSENDLVDKGESLIEQLEENVVDTFM